MARLIAVVLFLMCTHAFVQVSIENNKCITWPPSTSSCSQLCNNTGQNFSCYCVDGYKLDSDRKTCLATRPGPAYLFYIVVSHASHGSSLMRIELEHKLTRLLHHTRGIITCLAYDVSEEKVYYFDNGELAVKRINVNGDDVQDVITNGLFSVTAMDYDWLGRNLYIADSFLRKIFACSLKNAMCVDIGVRQPIVQPMALAVDSKRRMFYWSDASERTIVATSLDGTKSSVLVDRRTLVYEDPVSLFINQPINTLYWVDGQNIGLLKLDETGSVSIGNTTLKDVHYPGSVSVLEDIIYWTSSQGHITDPSKRKGVIQAANKRSLRNPLTIGPELSHVPAAMHLYHPIMQFHQINDCSGEQCSDICLLTDVSYKCACPVGKVLTNDGHLCIDKWDEPSLIVAHKSHILRILPQAVGAKTFDHLVENDGRNITALAYDSVDKYVYFADHLTARDGTRDATIGRISLENTENIDSLFEDLGRVTSLAVDWIARNLYWVDQDKKTIEVSRLDGSSRVVLVATEKGDHLDKLSAIAVDPIKRLLYYSDCGTDKRVFICDLSGDGCRNHSVTGCISDLFVNQLEQKLYWTNSGPRTVSEIALPLTNRPKITLDVFSSHPLSVVATDSNVYFTDYHKNNLQVRKPTKDVQDYQIIIGFSPLGPLISTENEVQPTGSNICSKDNGGCSDVCIAKSQDELKCLCPEYSKLDVDGKRCVDTDGLKSETTVRPTPHHRPTPVHRTASTSINTPALSHDLLCTDSSWCLNGGSCLKQNTLHCQCTSLYTGVRCELVLGSRVMTAVDNSISLTTYIWLVCAVCSLIFVFILFAITYLYFINPKRRTNMRQKVKLLQSTICGVSNKADAQAIDLVKPSYDNPGYFDVNNVWTSLLEDKNRRNNYQDRTKDCKENSHPLTVATLASSSESVDSAYNSRSGRLSSRIED